MYSSAVVIANIRIGTGRYPAILPSVLSIIALILLGRTNANGTKTAAAMAMRMRAAALRWSSVNTVPIARE